VVGGMLITFISLFSGFMIKRVDMPDFWTFM
jgi:ABC-type multidrug transport system permease subunit